MPDSRAPEGWRWTKLTDVARLETGHTPSRRHPEYWGGDVPWIGIKDATANHGRTIHDTIQHTNELGISNSSARILPANTVCLSRTASVGYVVVMGRPMATSQDFVNWVCAPELDHRFLKYVLLSEQSAFLRFASGTTHQTIYFPEVKAFHICLPSRAEQRAIGHVLQTLDDKIEVNRRMSTTLEAMARALFKAWFVDFEPVRAKSEGRDPGLPPHLTDLFPARLVETDHGEVPEGWNVSRIGNEVRVVGGSTPSTRNPAFWDGEINWATPKDLSSLEGPALLETSRRITSAGLAKIGSGLLPVGTVLLSSRAPIGYLAIAEIPVSVNQGFVAMVCEGRLSNVFAWLWTQANMEAILQNANGSTFQEISKSNFRPLPVIVPTDDVLEAFDGPVQSLHSRIVSCERETRTLAALRDTLLPQLISGDLRVKDAETFLDRVL
ncbi:restriction endonuclease subunit S [Tistlia consotensis]|nr:restriction endonuclease subunit S [Tistlia consotensis]